MFNVLAAAKETIGATSDLKVGCENSSNEAKLKFYCETKINGFVVESNENLKTSVAAVSYIFVFLLYFIHSRASAPLMFVKAQTASWIW